MPFGITAKSYQKLIDLFSSYNEIDHVIIYGSRAMGCHKEGSDIDLTIKGESINQSIIFDILNRIDDMLIPYKMDLSVYDKIKNSELLKHIEIYGKDFYKRV